MTAKAPDTSPDLRPYARITFQKLGRLRYLSHLDLARCFDRAIRRAGLPVAYTEGFNPHAKIAFASALGVGVGGAAELCAIDLARAMPGGEFADRLNAQFPEGLRVTSVSIEWRSRRSPFAQIVSAVYDIGLEVTPIAAASRITEAVGELLALPRIDFIRGTKSGTRQVDLRPGIHQLSAEVTDGPPRLKATLSMAEDSLVKPAEVVTVLSGLLNEGADSPAEIRIARVTRLALLDSE
jgi:radical SAM-linked protein